MLTYFGELFGPYPFEVYGSLVLNTEFGAALETQTLSIYGIDMIDPNDVAGTEEVVAHELSHQWFGDSVSVGGLERHLAQRRLRHLCFRVCGWNI